MDRLETSVGTLARRGFAEAARADRIVADWPSEWTTVIDAVAASADPDEALLGLDRLTQAVPGLPGRVADEETLRAQLLPLLASAPALGQHLVHHPELVDVLAAPLSRRSAQHWRTTLLHSVGADPAAAVPVAAGRDADPFRVAYRTALAQIAARDLASPDPLEMLPEIAAELSDLADAALDTALAVARAEVGPAAQTCRLAVIAMGKCGARELNYVSDVDVIFVAEPAEDAVTGAPVTGADEAVRIGTRLASALTRVCSAHTAAGTVWQVDAGLRPEGKAGPLARTLASMSGYYARWARTWEFQALLKARPAAGDRELGAAFVDLVRPRVWSVAEEPAFVADARAMRRRVVSLLPTQQADRELKLGAGGLRDVEFSVQLLQLVHGRADERVRAPATLDGLQALVDHGYVGREPGRELAQAYRFMRTVEHRIQLTHLRRTHLLPTDEAALRRLGRSIGSDEPGLMAVWRQTTQRVRRLHERIFYSPLLDAVARIPSAELRLTTAAAEDRLRALGYADPAAALRHIAALGQGVSRQAEIQRQLLPAMLGWIADGPAPDQGLLAFRQVSEALGSSPWYLRALRDEGAMAQRLAAILASGRYVVSLLLRSPQNVQLLADDAELDPRGFDDLATAMIGAARRHSALAERIGAIRGLRRRELFRIAVGDLLGRTDTHAVAEALTQLTSATLHAALTVARDDHDDLPDLAVIAMGRWGGRELSYGSDADAMIVMADADDPEAVREATTMFAHVRDLLARPSVEPAVVIDTSLRPEGRGGAEIRSLSAYRSYYQRWSSTWELQALVRADALVGSAELGAELMAVIDEHRWPADGLSAEQVMHIRKLKARMEAERLPRGTDPKRHLKLGPGGLSDVEWTVQLLQLRHGGAEPRLRTPATLTALRAARELGLVAPQDAQALADAWLFASRLRNQIMLVRGKAADVLPPDGGDLSAVAHLMGYPGRSSDLLGDHLRITRRARAVVERLFWAD